MRFFHPPYALSRMPSDFLFSQFLDTQPIPPQLQNPQTARSAPARSFSRAMGRSMGHSPAFGAFHEPIVTPPFTPIPPPNPHLKEAFMRETQRTPTHSARPRRGDMRTNTNERREMSRSDMDQLANYVSAMPHLIRDLACSTRCLNKCGVANAWLSGVSCLCCMLRLIMSLTM